MIEFNRDQEFIGIGCSLSLVREWIGATVNAALAPKVTVTVAATPKKSRRDSLPCFSLSLFTFFSLPIAELLPSNCQRFCKCGAILNDQRGSLTAIQES